MIVERYREADAAAWDAFVRTSRNGTFLFERGYMDYHSDRFADHSLTVRDEEGSLVALLPAHVDGNRVASHDGLSYGGLVVGPRMTTASFLPTFEAVLLAMQSEGLLAFDYKTIPHIYHRQPSEEDRFALHLLGATVRRRDLLSVVQRNEPLPYQHRRTRGIKKAQKAGVAVLRESDFAEFWVLLGATLADRFDAAPVHSCAEIQMLGDRFPLNIRLHTARRDGELLAGVVTYDSDRVSHAQYIASSPTGRDIGALDAIFDELLQDPRQNQTYFDLGSSHVDGGPSINAGLIEQKEGFGARAVVHDHYRIDLTTVRPGILMGAFR